MSDEMKNKVKASFSKNATAYVSSATHNNPSDLNLITTWLDPKPNWKVLDIATGGGHVAKELSHSGATVFATDLTKDMLQNTARHLKGHANIEYVIADAEELPFIDSSFDAVTCRIAPHHFPDPSCFIKEVQRVLKQGGRFLMIDNVAPESDTLDYFYNTFEKMRDSSHSRALKISEWKQLFHTHNLSIKKSLDRKKTLPFKSWLERTLDDETEQKKVEQYFSNASLEAENYFAIRKDHSSISSFSIDEWMVLCKN